MSKKYILRDTTNAGRKLEYVPAFFVAKEKGVDQGERSTLPETTQIYKTRPERYVAGSFLCPDVDRL